MSVQFFQTRMGRQFYEHTMPELVRQLERIADLLARLLSQQRFAADDPEDDA